MTSKLIKIRDILFYANTDDRLRETIEMERILVQNNIGCYHRIDLAFNDPDELLQRLRETTYGLDFQMFLNLELPIVTWKEYYDDYERCVNIATTPAELQSSNLIMSATLA